MTREEFMREFEAISKRIDAQKIEIEKEAAEMLVENETTVTLTNDLINQHILDKQNRLFNEQVQRDIEQNNLFAMGMI